MNSDDSRLDAPAGYDRKAFLEAFKQFKRSSEFIESGIQRLNAAISTKNTLELYMVYEPVRHMQLTLPGTAQQLQPLIRQALLPPAPDAVLAGIATKLLGCLSDESTTVQEELSNLASSEDYVVRAAAVEALGHFGRKYGLREPGPLLAGLGSTHVIVRNAAADALHALGYEGAALIAEWASSSGGIDTACWALGKMGSDAAPSVGFLLQVLDSGVESSIRVATEAIEVIGEAAVPALSTLLRSQSRTKRIAALRIAGRLGPKAVSILSDVLRNFEHSDRGIRSEAAAALRRIGRYAFGVAPQMKMYLTHGERVRRLHAVRYFESILGAARIAGPEIAHLLSDGSPAIRAAAASSLGRMGETGQSAARGLISAASDPEYQVRIAATRAIGMLDDPPSEAAAPLVENLCDRRRALRIASLRSLRRLPDFNCGVIQELRKTLEDHRPEVRIETMRTLGVVLGTGRRWEARKRDIGEVAAYICVLAENPRTVIRQTAARTLGLIGVASPGVIALLAELLRDPREAVAQEAAWALGRLGPRAANAVPNLIAALEGWDVTLKRQAAISLGLIGAPAKEALPYLENQTEVDAEICQESIRRIQAAPT